MQKLLYYNYVGMFRLILIGGDQKSPQIFSNSMQYHLLCHVFMQYPITYRYKDEKSNIFYFACV